MTGRRIRTGNGFMYSRHQLPRAGEEGFTIIELMIVITLIGILVGIAIPMYQTSIIRAKEAALKENLYLLRDTIDKYYSDHVEYPPSLATLVEKKYIRAVPEDPFTGSKDTWNEVPADSGPGVFDVRSGSDLTGRNGVPYNEW